MFHTYTILILGASLPIASGSIYPTRPTQATVWTAGRPELVSWIEDWKYPALNEMGVLDISLWCDTDTYLAQLASGVDPMTKTHSVTVPTAVLRQGSKYTLRFTTGKPVDVVVYSADFDVESTMTNGTSTTARTGTGSGDVASATHNGTESGFRTVVTTTGSSSSSSSSFSWTATPSGLGSTTPSGTPPPLGILPVDSQGQSQRASSAARRGMDMEKLKFRFVFVFWPVLMGVSMAL